MSSKCTIVGMDAEELGKTGLNLFLQFLGKFRGCPGQVCLDLIYKYHSHTLLPISFASWSYQDINKICYPGSSCLCMRFCILCIKLENT